MEHFTFYICEACGNVLIGTGGANVSCCGQVLQAVYPQKAIPAQKLQVDEMEDEWFISSDHPMRKDDYISFVAYISGGAINFVRQYPEWNLQLRLPRRGHGILVWYSRKQGLLSQSI